MLKQKINSRWFAVFDLACASASSLAWFFRPDFGWWPLVLALLPWFLRSAAGYFPFKRTPFDLPLLFFLLTAGIGVFAAYDTASALEKYWLLVGGIFVFYALAGQPTSNIQFVTALVAGLGALVALSVLFDAGLPGYTPDLGIIQRLLIEWEAVRPPLLVDALPPNVSGGMLAMLLPFPLFMGMDSLKKRRIAPGMFFLVPALLMMAALFLSSSRGAWVGIAAATAAILLLYGSKSTIRYLRPNYRIFLAFLLLAGLILGIRFAIVESDWIARTMDRLPGFPFGLSRLDLLANSWNLLADFPFTGGGLRSFPGLYSQYILHIPFLFLEYSHHLYMDIAVEQGVVGWLSFMVIFFGSLLLSVVRFVKSRDLGQGAYIQLAVIAGLVVVAIHGLIDDPLYGMRGTPLLFMLPGISAALGYADFSFNTREIGVPAGVLKNKPVFGSILLVIFLSLFLAQSSIRSLSAVWYANLGSIHMSKAELRGFPANSFEGPPESGDSLYYERYFSQALSQDARNVTANYRLGLLASRNGDFAAAVNYLEHAYAENNGHRGIRKALGYNYAWAAHPEQAAELLDKIPEARQELETYAWWWGTQTRADLALNSQAALEYLSLP